MAPQGNLAAGGLHVLLLLCCCVQWSHGFIAVSPCFRRGCSQQTLSSTNDLHKRESRGSGRHGSLIRRRSGGPGFSLKANEAGGGAEEEDDTLELTKGFYSEIAARLGKTAQGQPQDSQETAKDEDSGSEIDKAIYDELRARRDFGFEQDLGLELEKRNITKEAEAKKIIDAGLEQMPGVTSSATFLPSSELTPREVVTSVLEALKNNDQPYHNHGVEVFIRFLAPSSAMHGVEMSGVARYLAENRNRAFMHWNTMAFPRPLTVSGGAKQNKAFQPVKLRDTMTGAWHSVSVYLTLDARSNCWLIESCIVKGEV
ncbi:conserved unknown protein [Ectocarpus siliculosus]|uniref:Uncharacterized protein n=1 Tax=Ectocarpus siliculosus TaxID=2880 RepID=D7FII9_ECTSI|nr:conserved unknown protein [Ectocarpus siliculosus]|eukprot:CBJ28812.1 conserved unknown protein [Ectocarpus siliculosus]